jgi:flagellar protein FlbD
LNCDLIERIDSTPDTVVSLVDGKKYVVLESPAEVMVAIRRHRSEIIALSNSLQLHELAETEPPLPPRHAAPLANVAPLHREV